MLTYTSYYDTFKFNSNDEEITHLFDSYVDMKKIQEEEFYAEENIELENYLLFGDTNPFVNVKIN